VSKNREQLAAARLRAQQQQRQQLISIGVVVGTAVVAFVAMLLLVNRASAPQVTLGKYDTLAQNLTPEGLPILGDPNSRFQIMEFSDFGCPYCLQYKSTIDQIIDKHVRTGNARFVFAPQLFHPPGSRYATRGAFCAMEQGKFWEMHDELFYMASTEGIGFEPGNMKKFAEKLKLDTTKWLNCVATDKTEPAMGKAYELFTKMNAGGTPAMVWSGDGGATWNYFNNESGQPLTSGGVPIEIITSTLFTWQQQNM
jgi:protein-disulfide isomerase